MSNTAYSKSGARLQGQPQVVAGLGVIASPSVPTFQFSVLTCKPGVWATKTILPDNEIGYGKPAYFRFKYCEVELLEDFAKVVLEWLANEPLRFIIRGQLKPEFDALKWHYRRWRDHPGEPASIECPPRRWLVFDIDGAPVPRGLDAGDKVADAGYYVRDNLLPSVFRGVECVVVATAGTGRKGGPGVVHMRMYFMLAEAADNDALLLYVETLSQKSLWIDPHVMTAWQPIYTARPIFRGLSDPVPSWARVRILEGYTDTVELELPKTKLKKKHKKNDWEPNVIKCSDNMPDEWLVLTAQYEGRGVHALDISNKAWTAIREVFEALDGSPKNGIGRHKALNRAAYQIACLWAEGEIPKHKAYEAFLKAARGIQKGGGYDIDKVKRHLRDAFADVGGV